MVIIFSCFALWAKYDMTDWVSNSLISNQNMGSQVFGGKPATAGEHNPLSKRQQQVGSGLPREHGHHLAVESQ